MRKLIDYGIEQTKVKVCDTCIVCKKAILHSRDGYYTGNGPMHNKHCRAKYKRRLHTQRNHLNGRFEPIHPHVCCCGECAAKSGGYIK